MSRTVPCNADSHLISALLHTSLHPRILFIHPITQFWPSASNTFFGTSAFTLLASYCNTVSDLTLFRPHSVLALSLPSGSALLLSSSIDLLCSVLLFHPSYSMPSLPYLVLPSSDILGFPVCHMTVFYNPCRVSDFNLRVEVGHLSSCFPHVLLMSELMFSLVLLTDILLSFLISSRNPL